MSNLSNSNNNRLNQNASKTSFSISAEELKSILDSKQPLMVFDIGEKQRYEKEHIPGSSYAICNEESKKNIMPRLPKDIEIVLVAEKDDYTKQMAGMMRQMGLKVRYLQGGIKAWKWDFDRGNFDTTSSKNISAFELKENLDKRQGKNNGLFLLDVREPKEYADWHIDNSVNIPLSELSKEEALSQIPKDKEIITICPRGNRATIGKYIMQRYGYDVKVLEGGLIAWSTENEQAHREFEIEGFKVNVVQFRRIGKGCISYMIESNAEIAVIDPVFSIDTYIETAKKFNATITKVYDTHQHADHISAAKALAEKVTATLYRSAYEQYKDEEDKGKQTYSAISIEKLHDNDIQNIGSVSLRVIHTPGHTPGSLSFILGNKLLFTGDTLFVDGIGRPDLRDKAEEFAENLYNTIQQKIMKLSKDILILPAHFEKDVKTEVILASTLGEIKKKSQFLNPNITKEEFIQKISSKVMTYPPNYKEIISINKGERPVQSSLSEIFDLEMGPNRCSIAI
ncbi:MAG TPA: rhodanese-like domain-containing protein [Nitrososphaeraceae archaeon]|nr:rhodanese-like domain-containing protein [Nitrososphaeraceae archaeon]